MLPVHHTVLNLVRDRQRRLLVQPIASRPGWLRRTAGMGLIRLGLVVAAERRQVVLASR
jgi:hypothetical protein